MPKKKKKVTVYKDANSPLSYDLIPLVFSWYILCQCSLGVLGVGGGFCVYYFENELCPKFLFSVVYEHRSRLEKSLQKERLEHKKAKEGKNMLF